MIRARALHTLAREKKFRRRCEHWYVDEMAQVGKGVIEIRDTYAKFKNR